MPPKLPTQSRVPILSRLHVPMSLDMTCMVRIATRSCDTCLMGDRPSCARHLPTTPFDHLITNGSCCLPGLEGMCGTTEYLLHIAPVSSSKCYVSLHLHSMQTDPVAPSCILHQHHQDHQLEAAAAVATGLVLLGPLVAASNNSNCMRR